MASICPNANRLANVVVFVAQFESFISFLTTSSAFPLPSSSRSRICNKSVSNGNGAAPVKSGHELGSSTHLFHMSPLHKVRLCVSCHFAYVGSFLADIPKYVLIRASYELGIF